MDADEVVLWRYYLLEPRLEKRSDYHAAQICHAIYTSVGAFGGGKNNFKLEDNLLAFENTEEDQLKVMEKNKFLIKSAFALPTKKVKVDEEPNSK